MIVTEVKVIGREGRPREIMAGCEKCARSFGKKPGDTCPTYTEIILGHQTLLAQYPRGENCAMFDEMTCYNCSNNALAGEDVPRCCTFPGDCISREHWKPLGDVSGDASPKGVGWAGLHAKCSRCAKCDPGNRTAGYGIDSMNYGCDENWCTGQGCSHVRDSWPNFVPYAATGRSIDLKACGKCVVSHGMMAGESCPKFNGMVKVGSYETTGCICFVEKSCKNCGDGGILVPSGAAYIARCSGKGACVFFDKWTPKPVAANPDFPEPPGEGEKTCNNCGKNYPPQTWLCNNLKWSCTRSKKYQLCDGPSFAPIKDYWEPVSRVSTRPRY